MSDLIERARSYSSGLMNVPVGVMVGELADRIEQSLALHPVERWHVGYFGQEGAPLTKQAGCPTCHTVGPCRTRQSLDPTPLNTERGDK